MRARSSAGWLAGCYAALTRASRGLSQRERLNLIVLDRLSRLKGCKDGFRDGVDCGEYLGVGEAQHAYALRLQKSRALLVPRSA